MIFNLLVPVILVAFLGFTLGQQPKGISFIMKHSDYIYPVALAYTFLIQINWVFNSFAYDGVGIQFLILAPVRFSEVFVGKNLFQGVVAFVDVFTADGTDSSAVFVDMLRSLGARVSDEWNERANCLYRLSTTSADVYGQGRRSR